MLDIKLNKKSTYLLACTFGSDSMCLLDKLLKEGLKPIICFINYHKLGNDTADLEALSAFCGSHLLKLESIDVNSVDKSKYGDFAGDFRSWSRDLRYSFFKQVYDKYDAEGLFIAHNQDDLLEDYLLTEKDPSLKKNFSDLTPLSESLGMIIYRPLLNYSKEDILEYNKQNNVTFSEASTSYEEQYIKHPVRFDVIEKLSAIERDNLLSEIKGEKAEKLEFIRGLQNKIEVGDELDVREIIALDKNEFVDTITRFIKTADESIKVNKSLLSDIRSMCLDKEENKSIKLTNKLFIFKEYDVLTIGGNLDEPLYSYVLPKPGKLKTDYFFLDFSNGASDRGFRLSDYPLTIRPAVPNDQFYVHGFMTPVRKLYYDWRMPASKKLIWPVIANKHGEIIYIPRYHRLHRTEHSSVFEINFLEED